MLVEPTGDLLRRETLTEGDGKATQKFFNGDGVPFQVGEVCNGLGGKQNSTKHRLTNATALLDLLYRLLLLVLGFINLNRAETRQCADGIPVFGVTSYSVR